MELNADATVAMPQLHAIPASGRASDVRAADALVPVARLRATEADSQAWTSLLQLVPAVTTRRLFYYCVVKRAIDVAIASFMLLLGAPLLLLLWLTIRLDSPGPAVFRQTRVGRCGRPFTVFKFRTMEFRPNAEFTLLRDADGRLRHKIKNDPRVTRVGKVLRKTSLDELPQLWNVLRGEMSLVGPRPELLQIVQSYEPWQHDRHLVRPGITGWWQTSGRSDKPMHENTDLDIYYVENISLGLDIRVIIRTIKVVVLGSGAF
jgi:exopolysaccharide biosynthesis polyprenyl glycosylphosphotransferase